MKASSLILALALSSAALAVSSAPAFTGAPGPHAGGRHGPHGFGPNGSVGLVPDEPPAVDLPPPPPISPAVERPDADAPDFAPLYPQPYALPPARPRRSGPRIIYIGKPPKGDGPTIIYGTD
jgi:hypothetical protein